MCALVGVAASLRLRRTYLQEIQSAERDQRARPIPLRQQQHRLRIPRDIMATSVEYSVDEAMKLTLEDIRNTTDLRITSWRDLPSGLREACMSRLWALALTQ